MKSLCKRIGKTSLSLILCLMMVMSTMLVGTITSSADTSNSTGERIIYYNYTSSWGTPYAYIWVKNTSTSVKSWPGTKMTKVSGNVYCITVPERSGTAYNMIIFSNNGSSQTSDLDMSSTKNYYSSGSWSTYQQTSTAKLSADKSSVEVNNTVNLTPSLSSNTTYNDVKSTAYTVKKGSETATVGTDYTMSENSFTPLQEGTYTITATVTYNAKGFTSITKTATAVATVTATIPKHNVTFTQSDNGTISVDKTSVAEGDDYTVTLTPDEDYVVDTFTVDGVDKLSELGEDNTYTATMGTTDVAITATFALAGNKIIVNDPENGTISVKPKAVPEGSTYKVTLTPNEGYEVDTFTVDGTDKKSEISDNTYTGTMGSSDVNVAVTYKKSDYTITYIAKNGTVTGSTTGQIGDEISLTVTPNAGYQLVSITADNDVVIEDNKFTMPAKNVTVTATFELKDPTVTLEVSKDNCNVGEEVTLTPTVTAEIDYTGAYTVKKGEETLDTDTYIKDGKFVTPNNSDSVGTYVVTYTATITDDGVTKTASESKSITVTQSDEQVAYNELKAGLDDGTYPDYSETSFDDVYTTQTLADYRTAFANANTVVEKGYPVYNGTENTTAKTALDTAKANLKEKETLATPTVTVTNKGILTSGAGVDIEVTNTSVYTDEQNVTFVLLKDGEQVGTATKPLDGNVKFSLTFALNDEGKYTVKAVTGDTDNFKDSENSEEVSISKASTVNITLESVDNATVTATYTDAYGETGTLNEGKTAEIPTGSEVTVTATVDKGYIFDSITYGDTVKTSTTATFTVNATDTTISTQLHEVAKKTIKIAAIEFVAFDHKTTSDNWYLKDKNISYTSPSGNGTCTLTEDTDEPTAYFTSGSTTHWSNEPVLHYIYDAVVNEDSTSITVKWYNGTTKTINLTNADYYQIYNYSNVQYYKAKSITDKYQPIKVTANHDVDESSTASIVSSTPSKTAVHGSTSEYVYKYGSKLTLSATQSDSAIFGFDHWSDGTTEFTDNTYTVTKDATLTAFFKYNQTYDITLVPVDHATINCDDVEAYAGKKVTVTVTPEEAYKVTGLTVKAGEENVEVTDNKDNTYTFTMPESAVNISATVAEREEYVMTVTAMENGAANVDKNIVLEGDEVTFTATPNPSYALKTWSIKGSYDIVSGSLTSNEITIKPKEDISATATFKHVNYYLVNSNNQYNKDDSVPFYQSTSDDNVYVAPVSIASNTTFTLYDGSSYMKNSNGSLFTFSSTNTSSSPNIWGDSYSNCFKNSTGKTQYVCYDVKHDKLYLKTTYDGPATHKVYAKYGTVRNGYSGSAMNNTDTYGITTIVAGNYGTSTQGTSTQGTSTYPSHDSYKVYNAVDGAKVTVQTTLNSTQKDAGYYVEAFCVNGKTVRTDFVDKERGIYKATFEVSCTDADNNCIEITPVYFNSKIDNYITLYVDRSENSEWDTNTISYYTWYSDNSQGAESWPGQPLLQDGNGKYYTKIAKTLNGKDVNGVSFTEYLYDTVHNTIYNNGTYQEPSRANLGNRQTYDYNEFKTLAADDYTTIEYRMHSNVTSTSNQSRLLSNSTSAPSKSGTTISLNSYNFVDFLNYDRKISDIFGNVATDSSKKLYIVSCGNQNIGSIGKFATVWYVFDSSGKYITQGTPNEFITQSGDKYDTIKNAGYLNCATKISYEKEMNGSTSVSSSESLDNGIRSDGKWVATKKTEAQCNVKIKYQTSDSETFVLDENSNTENTGYMGTVTGSVAKINESTSADVKLNTEANLSSVPGSGWIFEGWYIEKNTTSSTNSLSNDASTLGIEEVKISDTPQCNVKVSNDSTYIAKYIEAPSGSLTINHTKYSEPDAQGGLGYYYVAATVFGDDGSTVIKEYKSTDKNITIDPEYLKSTYSVKITLTTTCAGDNQFYSWYEGVGEKYQIIGPEDVDYRGQTGTVSYSWIVKANKFFDGTTQVVNTLNFYSDISPVTGECELTYKYIDRFGDNKEYVKTVTLEDEYIEEHGYLPTTELIYKNAPYIGDVFKDCVWKVTEEHTTITGSKATVVAVQPQRTYQVTVIYPKSSDGKMTREDVFDIPLNGLVLTEDGEFYVAPETYNGKKFSYWNVVDHDHKDADGNPQEVAKCYYKTFTLKIAGDYEITAVYDEEIKDSVTSSNAAYTRDNYTKDGKVYDYLYADFILAYMSADGDLIRDNSGYKTGLIVVLNKDKKVKDDDGKYVENVDGGTINIEKQDHYDTSHDDIITATSQKEKCKFYDNSGYLYNISIDNNSYNNFNRVQKYVKFSNTKEVRLYLFKAYYYVVKPNGEVVISENPTYFSYYNIGNSKVSTD